MGIPAWINAPIFQVGDTPVTLAGIASAFLIIIAALSLSALLQRVLGPRLSKKLNLNPGVAHAIQRAVHYIILFLAALIATQCLGLDLGSLAVIVGFLSVGIGLGLQTITSNFISGLILLFERPVGVGDIISVGDLVGTVDFVGLRATHVTTLDNVTLIVSNAQFIETQVTNWSHGDTRVRVHAAVGVAYGSDLKQVTEALLRVADEHPLVLKNPKPEVRFIRFGDSSLDFELLVWIEQPQRQYAVLSQLNYAVDAAFRECEITIPFPQRDLHIQPTAAIDRLASRA